jgi:hypothetical protein
VIPKRKPKPKRPSLPSLITKADTVTSQYIRQKYADHAGNVTCISCPTVLPWKEAHCAHFIERGKKATRWLEENLHPACPSCNFYRKEIHMREYTLAMIDLYGREGIEEIKAESRLVLRGYEVRQLSEDAIEYYSKALKELIP